MTNENEKNVLIVDCYGSSSYCTSEQLRLHGYKVKVISDCRKAREWLPRHSCDAIIVDFHIKQKSEVEFMTWVKDYKKEIPLMAMLEDESVFEEAREFCDKAGNIPLFSKDFAALEALDHLDRARAAG